MATGYDVYPALRRPRFGEYAVKLIAARIAGPPAPKPFRYVHLGDSATIGRRAATVEFGPVKLKGFLGLFLWCDIHIYFLIGLRNRFSVAFNWLWDEITFQRGARLITHPDPLEMKAWIRGRRTSCSPGSPNTRRGRCW